MPTRSVERDCEAAVAGPQPQDGGVEAGAPHGARADEMVVALGTRPRGSAGSASRAGRRATREAAARGRSGDRRSLGPRPLLDLVARALVGEEARRDLADDLVLPERAQQPGVGHLADDGAGELPPVAERLDRLEHLRPDDRDHPLLALGDHDLPGLHALLPQRDAVEVEVDAGLARHLGERGGETGGAAVLQRLDEAALDELDRDLDQLVARERVADLHGRPLVRVVLAELLAREHGCAADPVAARRRAVEHDEVPRARSRPRA